MGASNGMIFIVIMGNWGPALQGSQAGFAQQSAIHSPCRGGKQWIALGGGRLNSQSQKRGTVDGRERSRGLLVNDNRWGGCHKFILRI